MTTVAVVGLGTMGSRIARRLIDAGQSVVVWNRDPSKAAALTELGAVHARSPAEAAASAEVIATIVADPRALREVTEGAAGVAAGAAGTTVVQMSTAGLAALQRLQSVLPAGAELLDAPVLGSVAEAESGTLKIFIGGEPALVERWSPLLSELGSVLPVGPLGAGTAAKLVANMTLLGVLGVLGEALALAERMQLPHEVAFEVLALTPLAAQAERRRPSIETGEFPTRFALSLARKDAELILDAAAAAGAELRLTEAVRSWLADAEEAGLGAEDYSAVLAQIAGAR